MKKILGKKQLLLAVLVLALGTAVYLNYHFSMSQPPVSSVGTDTEEQGEQPDSEKNLGDSQLVSGKTDQVGAKEDKNDYFVSARTNRQSAREEALDIIKDTAADVKSNEELQREALEKAAKIAAAVEQESKIESLIKAKGFKDCIAFIEVDKCSIVVRSDGLTPAAALQITEIITDQSDILAANVNIVPVK